jgi:hypothetical protein
MMLVIFNAAEANRGTVRREDHHCTLQSMCVCVRERERKGYALGRMTRVTSLFRGPNAASMQMDQNLKRSRTVISSLLTAKQSSDMVLQLCEKGCV